MAGRPVLCVLTWLAFLAISVATPENVERVGLGSKGVGEDPSNAILVVGLDSHVRGLKSNNACPAGSIYDTALTNCSVICAGGKYRDITGSTTLESIAVVGSCKACAPGTARDTSDTVLDACALCPVGTSNARPGQVTCIPCSFQGENVYANETGSTACTPCPANTHQRTGEDVTEVGFSLDACVCKSGFYSPTANLTGTACEPCPMGATCAGDVSRPISKSLYYGYAHPYEEYFMRCHRMINNESPCLGDNRCMQGFEGMSCSRCQKGWYRFQRKCVKCEDGTEAGLYVAYFFLLVAFYIVKKLSTIVLPSMYIILTYIQCLSIVGNRQGWGTKRTKAVLKSTEIVNFSLDLFIPSCSEEIPFVHKAVFFTFTPIFYVLVDVCVMDPFIVHLWPRIATSLARTLLRIIRMKHSSFSREANDDAGKTVNEQLRDELGDKTVDFLEGLQGLHLRSPVEAEDAINDRFRSNPVARVALKWAARHTNKRRHQASSTNSAQNDQLDPPLTFSQKIKKHFFEDMRLMYVATTGALLKALRCTPVGNRDVQKFWLSEAWFGESMLSTDPQQQCWTGAHGKLAPYFIVMLVLYGLGYPVATLIVLNNAKNPKVRQGWHPKVYGRLYRRFEPQYYWWEVIYLMRRLCLVSFRTLMNDRRAEVYAARTMQGWQALCFIITVCVALLAQFYAHPFKLEHMDLLDATLLCCLFLIVWLSMSFEIALKGTTEVDVLEFFVFLVIFMSIIISAYALLLDMYHSYAKSKKPTPRWIMWTVFTFTPPTLLIALGLVSRNTAAQMLEHEIEREQTVLAREAYTEKEERAEKAEQHSGARLRKLKSTKSMSKMQASLKKLRSLDSWGKDINNSDDDVKPSEGASVVNRSAESPQVQAGLESLIISRTSDQV